MINNTGELARLQEDFQSYLLLHDPRMTEQVIGTVKASAGERLTIYSNAYRLRLLEALETDFLTLHSLVGDAEFDRLGRAYIEAHPSEHPSLRWFGRNMSVFLREIPPYAAQPVLAEIAAFEWAQGEVFDVEDKASIDIEQIGALAPDAWPIMRLTFHPSVRRMALDWNTVAIWSAIDKQESPPAPERTASPILWLLWRSDLRIHWRSLGADEAWAIDAGFEGGNFGEICAGLCNWVEESSVAFHAAGMLKRWVVDGLIARVSLD